MAQHTDGVIPHLHLGTPIADPAHPIMAMSSQVLAASDSDLCRDGARGLTLSVPGAGLKSVELDKELREG